MSSHDDASDHVLMHISCLSSFAIPFKTFTKITLEWPHHQQFSHIAGVNLCMQSGCFFWMKILGMHMCMELSYNLQMEYPGVFFCAFLHMQQTTQKSMFVHYLYYIVI